MDTISALMGFLAALSVATERLTETIKGLPLLSSWLANPRPDGTTAEEARKATIHLIAISIGTLLASMVRANLATLLHFKDASAVSFPVCLSIGAMTSGGSALWNSALDITREISRQKSALTAQLTAGPAAALPGPGPIPAAALLGPVQPAAGLQPNQGGNH